MMHLEKAVREAVAREVAPLFASCEQIRAGIDRAEAAIPILLDTRERAAARINVIALRLQLDALLGKLETVADRCVALARERGFLPPPRSVGPRRRQGGSSASFPRPDPPKL
jgi:hypothetical protein